MTPDHDDCEASSDAPALTGLRDILLEVVPAGASGFEGLVVHTLAAVTGLAFRLARSGSQFGRDASSDPSPFAIAVEAKRYRAPLRLEDLAGKAVLAADELADRIELWVLCATIEVGDDVVLKLHEILERRGITALALDWTSGPIPRLAALLAIGRDATLEWFERHAPEDSSDVRRALDEVRGNPSFEAQAADLRRRLSAPEMGLDAVRRASARWNRRCFDDARASRVAFGQVITIEDRTSPPVARPALEREFTNALHASSPGSVIVVHGDEGCGKTWLVAAACSTLPEEPILIFAAGRRGDRLDPADPLRTLVSLIAEQAQVADLDSAGWLRRLERWKRDGGQGALRFVLVIDGLNERSRMPWADILMAFAPQIESLGGRIVATTRSAFWRRDVAPRLGCGLPVHEVTVGDYTEEELREVLEGAGLGNADMPPRVRRFLCNPRVCSVALRMRTRLNLQAGDLTIERLLLDYWRYRLEDRGDLVAHRVSEFEKLLRSHARAWLAHPDRAFDRDEWLELSGAASRGDRLRFVDDLTEIEEGRFLQVAGDDSYAFRSETLPFALALLLHHELKQELAAPDADADECVARAVDPIRGFDAVADALGAAVGLCCLDARFPPVGRAALLRAWLRLQNVGDTAIEAMASYVPSDAALFLDVAESREVRRGSLRADLVVELLLRAVDDPRCQGALYERVVRWLGVWCRTSDDDWIRDADAKEQRRAARKTRIDGALSAFTLTEREVFAARCVETPEPTSLPFPRVVARLLAGRPLVRFVPGLLAWALTRAVVADDHEGTDELTWVVLLNEVDPEETASAIRALVEPLTVGASEPVRRAAATMLDLVADPESARVAAELVPREPMSILRSVTRFCETNPHDPDAPPGLNLAEARASLSQIAPSDVCSTFSTTIDDHVLEQLVPALARFEPALIVSFLREVVHSAPDRSGMPLRQLALQVPKWSPLLDDVGRAVVEAVCRRLARERQLVPADADFAVAKLAAAVLPHLGARAQLDFLRSLAGPLPAYLFLGRAVRPLDAATLEAALEDARTTAFPEQVHRTLFFASASRSPLTRRSREIVIEQLAGSDERLAGAASWVVCDLDDPDLNAMVVDIAGALPTGTAQSWRSGAIATAVAQQGRLDLIRFVAPAYVAYVAGVTGGCALDAAMDAIEKALRRLLLPVRAVAPSTMTITVGPDRRGPGEWRSFEEIPKSRSGPETLAEFTEQFDRPDAQKIQRHAEERERLRKQIADFESALTAEGAEALLDSPPRRELAVRLADRDPVRVGAWLDEIAATRDAAALGRVRNLAAVIAGGYAAHDAEKSATVLRRLRASWSPVRIIVGRAAVGVIEQAVFSAPRGDVFDGLRAETIAEAMNDAALETVVAAEELGEAHSWLDAYVEESLHAATPPACARALAVAGLRSPNPQSDDVLRRDWGPGHLGNVAGASAENYRRHTWALRWFELARGSVDSIDFWRYGQLAVEVADWRLVGVMEGCERTDMLDRFGAELFERVVRRAEKRSQERERTLFGHPAPARELSDLLVARRRGT